MKVIPNKATNHFKVQAIEGTVERYKHLKVHSTESTKFGFTNIER